MAANDSGNIAKVQALYAAFGRGDIQTIVDALSENVEWRATTPWDRASPLTSYSGKKGVEEFFTSLGSNVEFSAFEPKEFAANGDLVVALGFFAARAIPTGKTFDAEWAMAFVFSGDKVASFREYVDATQGLAAFAAPAAASAT